MRYTLRSIVLLIAFFTERSWTNRLCPRQIETKLTTSFTVVGGASLLESSPIVCTCSKGEWSTDCYLGKDGTCNNIRPVSCLPFPECSNYATRERRPCECDLSSPNPKYEPYCGDTVCEYTENCQNCPSDCGFYTNDSSCDAIVSCKKYNIGPGYPTSTGRAIVLTFDDGPGEHTERLLDILKEKNAKATFFLIGINVLRFPTTILRMIREGHTIANHSFSHLNITESTNATFINDMLLADEAFYYVTLNQTTQNAHIPTLMRPPYGVYTDRVKELVAQLNYTPVMWKVDSNDWKYYLQGAERIAAEVIEQTEIETGMTSVIHLGHDLQLESVEAIATVIDHIRARNWTIISMHECLGVNPDVLYQFQRREISTGLKKTVILKSADDLAYYSEVPLQDILKLSGEASAAVRQTTPNYWLSFGSVLLMTAFLL